MDLTSIWERFINRLILHPLIESANWKKVAGIPFLYIIIDQNLPQSMLEKEIARCSAYAMRGKRLHCETVYVRNEHSLFVYRHRFYVPLEKMFCCGNLCSDCIRKT
nr:hypothetical protein [Neobacillus sp. Marseille-Q6967]